MTSSSSFVLWLWYSEGGYCLLFSINNRYALLSSVEKAVTGVSAKPISGLITANSRCFIAYFTDFYIASSLTRQHQVYLWFLWLSDKSVVSLLPLVRSLLVAWVGCVLLLVNLLSNILLVFDRTNIEFLQLSLETLRHRHIQALGGIFTLSNQIEVVEGMLVYSKRTCRLDLMSVPAWERL